jgi:hypothetical protein
MTIHLKNKTFLTNSFLLSEVETVNVFTQTQFPLKENEFGNSQNEIEFFQIIYQLIEKQSNG